MPIRYQLRLVLKSRATKVVIGLGSNLKPEINTREAIDLLSEIVIPISLSTFIYTKPIGIKDQPTFLNGALLGLTDYKFKDLKMKLKKIEDKLKRDRNAPKYGPRTIDLDILLWSGKIVDKDVYKRSFLKNSIKEILPDFIF